MLILRTFPFSFNILWRLALVLPLIILALLFFAVIGLLWFFLFALIFPALAAVFVGVLSFASTSVIPTMVGTRLGLQARGVIPANTYGGLFLPALGYGLFEGLVGLIIFATGFGLFVLASHMTFEDIVLIYQQQPETALEAIVAESPLIGVPITFCVGFGFIALRALLLVPLAGASVGRDSNGGRHTPFVGFGSHFGSLSVVVFLSYLFSMVFGPVLVLVGLVLFQGDPAAAASGGGALMQNPEGVLGFGVKEGILAGLIIILWLWMFSLQCAGAVLVYLRNRTVDEYLAKQQVSAQRLDSEDLRELWKSRMPIGRK